MVKAKLKAIKWFPDVEGQDYLAAQSYLSILFKEARVARIIAKFKRASIVQFQAKDIFRASQLPVLGVGNSHVEMDSKRIRQGQSLSPLLLLRDKRNGKVVIADGYHRMCAIYEVNEDAWIRCKII
jgi:disulfide oxidoreductase YuzD